MKDDESKIKTKNSDIPIPNNFKTKTEFIPTNPKTEYVPSKRRIDSSRLSKTVKVTMNPTQSKSKFYQF